MNRVVLTFLAGLAMGTAFAQDPAFEARGQATYVRQFKPSFPAAYSGPNSLRTRREWGHTFTSTLFAAAKLGETEFHWNPEFVSGTAFSDLRGLGGFANGENQRGAGDGIRGYHAKMFLRQSWGRSAERVVLTAGKLSVLDVFDAMDYSRDARTQFLNWASLTYGAWDYPADARGYTWGAALEYATPGWQARAGRFLVPLESNGLRLDWSAGRHHGDVAELELPYALGARQGIVRLLAFRNRVDAGRYREALAGGALPDVSTMRRTQSKRGFGVGTQLELSEHAGAFVRAGWNDGRTETFMFTEIDRSLSAGVLLKGAAWSRPGDSAGVAAYAHGLSKPHRDYLAAGGLGFFLGDGRLSYGRERILEGFYSLSLGGGVSLSPGWQRIWNPGYNRDRGPAQVLSLRLHAEF